MYKDKTPRTSFDYDVQGASRLHVWFLLTCYSH